MWTMLLGGKSAAYEIYRRDTLSGESVFVDAVDSATLSYTVTGLVADSIAYYHIEAVSECGVRSELQVTARLRRVAMDGSNQLIPPAPNAPHGLTLKQRAGGQVIAFWRHSNGNGEVDVANFNIYVATGVDPFNFTTPAYTVGKAVLKQDLGSFANGTTVRVVVRAEDTAGTEETNTNEATTAADAAAPPAPASLSLA